MSEKLNQQLEQQDLEAMADQLLAEDAAKREEEDSKSRKKLDDKTIAALPAATLITANEKLKDLLAKGCKTGKLDPGELSDVVDTMDLDGDQMDRIYDSLADLGIEVGSDEFLTDLPDDGEPPLEEIAEIEEEELVDPNTLVDSFNIDDPVRMYLMQMGEIPMLTRDMEVDSAKRIEATRTRFRRTMLCNDFMLHGAAELLQKVADGNLRLDRTIEISVTNTAEKKRVLKRIGPNLDTIRHLLAQNQTDYRIAVSQTDSAATKRDAWRRMINRRNKAVRLVEELEKDGSYHTRRSIGSKSPKALMHIWSLRRI